ncbi:MAG: hypothetical protein ABII82_03785 [Verrucomicrobiota bacterium]
MKAKRTKDKFRRCVMRANYTTAAGFQIVPDSVHLGTQSREGGPVEIYIGETNERVCFTARECGLAPQS